MLNDRDFTSSADDWLVEQAMDFMLFVTINDARRVSADMNDKVRALAYHLSALNNEFECAFYKSIDNIKTCFIEPAIKNMDESSLTFSSKTLEDRALEVTQKILHTEDQGATLDGLMDLAKNNYSTLPNAQRAYNMISIVKKLKDFSSLDFKLIANEDVKSSYDTYCINFYNMLFEKYQEMLNIYQTISDLQAMSDALTIVEVTLSKENLTTFEKISDFLQDAAGAKQKIKSYMIEYLKEKEK